MIDATETLRPGDPAVATTVLWGEFGLASQIKLPATDGFSTRADCVACWRRRKRRLSGSSGAGQIYSEGGRFIM